MPLVAGPARPAHPRALAPTFSAVNRTVFQTLLHSGPARLRQARCLNAATRVRNRGRDDDRASSARPHTKARASGFRRGWLRARRLSVYEIRPYVVKRHPITGVFRPIPRSKARGEFHHNGHTDAPPHIRMARDFEALEEMISTKRQTSDRSDPRLAIPDMNGGHGSIIAVIVL